MQRAVARGLAPREAVSPRCLYVDETSFRKHHDYVTAVTDPQAGTGPHLAEKRRTESQGSMPAVGRSEGWIEAVAMDMCVLARLDLTGTLTLEARKPVWRSRTSPHLSEVSAKTQADAAREGGCKELAILHCVSGYPEPAGD